MSLHWSHAFCWRLVPNITEETCDWKEETKRVTRLKMLPIAYVGSKKLKDRRLMKLSEKRIDFPKQITVVKIITSGKINPDNFI